MGLDMYLEAEIYIGAGKLKGAVENADGSKVNLPDMPISYLKYDVAYWRKAYAIQSWFFYHVGDIDNGGRVYVPTEDLKELLGVAIKVLAPYELFLQEQKNKNPNALEFYKKAVSVAKKLLPDLEDPDCVYGEWYFGQIINTVKQLDKVLKLCERFPDISIYYTANW